MMGRWRKDGTEAYVIKDDTRSWSLGRRVRASILAGIAWLVFLLLWLTMVADSLSIYRNLAIIFLSMVVTAALVGSMWANYLKGIGRRYVPDQLWQWESQRLHKKITSILVLWGTWASLVVIWLYLFADDLSGYQNIAVIVVAIIALHLATSSLWRDRMAGP